MGLFLKDIESFVRDTLNKRQNDTTQRYKWLTTKGIWVKATSLVEINGDPNIRKKWILGGGVYHNGKQPSGYTQLYDTESNRPLPGITSIEVKNAGSIGGSREATINFKCYTIEQFEILEKLFLTWGMSILLEWGYSYTIDGEQVITDLADREPMTDYCATQEIKKLREKYKGHYDGMQGVITNMSWSIEQDGSFNCSTNIVSVGDMFLDVMIHSKTKKLTKATVDNERVLEDNMKATIQSIVDHINESREKIYRINDQAVAFRIDIEFKGKDSNFKEFDKKEDHQYFVKWDFFEKAILNDNIAFESDRTNDCLSKDIRFLQNPKNTVPLFDSSETKLSYTGFQFTSDPMVCILPYSNVMFINRGFVSTYSTIPQDFKINLENENYFYLKDLLLNLRVVVDALEKNDRLTDFMNYILNLINQVNADSWELGLFVDEDEPNIIRVIDFKVKEEEVIKFTPFEFKINNVNSIVRQFSINTNASEDIKAMIMYGSNQKRNESSNDSTSFEYSFFGSNLRNLAYGKLDTKSANSQIDTSSKIEKSTNGKKWSKQDYEKQLEKAFRKVYNSWAGRTDENVQNLRNIMVKCKVDNFGEPISQKDYTSQNYAYIPLNLNITIDGISGIKYGSLIAVDYLPERYLNNTVFMITNVSHSIQDNDWSTSMETIMRVDMSNIEYESPQQLPTYKSTKSTSAKKYIQPTTIQEDQTSETQSDYTQKDVLWILDAGHGFSNIPNYKRYPFDNQTDGSGVPQLLEYKFNREVVEKIISLLSENNILYYKLINTDEDIPINERVRMVNSIVENNPDKLPILVSIHGNKENITRGQGKAAGVMTIVSTKEFIRAGKSYKKDSPAYEDSIKYASVFYDKLNYLWQNNVQKKQLFKDFWVSQRPDLGLLNFTKCPALITENGFYTNPIDRKFMLSEDGQWLIAKAHVEAIIQIEKLIKLRQIS